MLPRPEPGDLLASKSREKNMLQRIEELEKKVRELEEKIISLIEQVNP